MVDMDVWAIGVDTVGAEATYEYHVKLPVMYTHVIQSLLIKIGSSAFRLNCKGVA
jgi:hypothetical protein